MGGLTLQFNAIKKYQQWRTRKFLLASVLVFFFEFALFGVSNPDKNVRQKPHAHEVTLLGKRRESLFFKTRDTSPVTIIITGFDQRRMKLLERSINYYCGNLLMDVVHKVILVWNNPGLDGLNIASSECLLVLKMNQNRLNNRWIMTIKHIETEAVLQLDDDLLIEKESILCLYSVWKANQKYIVGPFARRIYNGQYIFQEVHLGEYNMIIGRCMMHHVSLMKHYQDLPGKLTEADIGCDDVLFNAAIIMRGGLPLHIKLPFHGIRDYYTSCFQTHPNLIGGLALGDHWSSSRSECIQMLSNNFPRFTFPDIREKAHCQGPSQTVDSDQSFVNDMIKLEPCASIFAS